MLRMRAVLCKREPALILGHAEACARPPACVYISGMQKPIGPNPAPAPALACEVCILAGGLSSRMGRNKAALRLGGRTLLARIRALAKPLSLPVRVIRIDLIPGCGPLGGIQTALATSRAAGSLFLSCDMPFVSTDLLRRILRGAGARTPALFVREAKEFGFPFLLRRSWLTKSRTSRTGGGTLAVRNNPGLFSVAGAAAGFFEAVNFSGLGFSVLEIFTIWLRGTSSTV